MAPELKPGESGGTGNVGKEVRTADEDVVLGFEVVVIELDGDDIPVSDPGVVLGGWGGSGVLADIVVTVKTGVPFSV